MKRDKRVFIVTSGEHDEYSIHRVFTDRAKAERYASLVHDARVEEHPLETRLDSPVRFLDITYCPYAFDETRWEVNETNHSRLDREDGRWGVPCETVEHWLKTDTPWDPNSLDKMVIRIVMRNASHARREEQRLRSLCPMLWLGVQEKLREGMSRDDIDKWLKRMVNDEESALDELERLEGKTIEG
ncbi:MAG: hypothetical protein ACYCYO_01670 [Bacilli bacterium]